MQIRGYRASDRAGVRRVCFETGYMGDPVAWQWRDEASFADLFSGWYTDHAGDDALVVEGDGGEVVGYLLGCRDTRAIGGATGRLARHHLLRRGLLVRPGTARVLWRTIGDVAVATARRRLPPGEVIDDRWPAHLHIDLLPAARGTGVGRQLMTRWLDALRADDIAGCHLTTWAENDGAIAFFEAMGFRREGPPQPMLGLRSPEGHRHHTQLMVQPLGSAP
ncbi:MAG TPA: GNAT family N-acetyltransferase [Iamia sp.]